MDKIIKNILGIAAIAVIASFAFAALKFANTYDRSSEPTSFRSFEVSAEGKAVSVPDVARFTFSVRTEGGKDVAALQQQNIEKMNAAIALVKNQSVDEKDVKTQNYDVSPRYEYHTCPRDGGSCPPPEIVGYAVSQSVEVTIRDFENISPILAGVVDAGANEVSQLSFTIDDPTSVENEARVEAIAKAKEKAKAIAKAGGFGLGRLLSIEEGGSASQVYNEARTFALKAYDEAGSAPSIEAGSQETIISVVLEYEIE